MRLGASSILISSIFVICQWRTIRRRRMASFSYYEKVNDFCDRLRQRRVDGSLAAAKGTAELMRQLVTSSKLNDPRNMLIEVRKVGNIIQAAKPIGG